MLFIHMTCYIIRCHMGLRLFHPNLYTHVYLHLQIYTDTHIHKHSCTPIHTLSYRQVYTHTQICIYIHAVTYTYTSLQSHVAGSFINCQPSATSRSRCPIPPFNPMKAIFQDNYRHVLMHMHEKGFFFQENDFTCLCN